MGDWGAGNFENDTAMDWVYDLQKSNRLKLLKTTISNVLKADQYIEGYIGSEGLAAAEVVAALNGSPAEKLPPKVVDWVKSQKRKPNDKLINNAKQAVIRIRNEDISELKVLWEEGDEPPTEWYAAVDDLIERLV